jgi:DNA modification methylase
MSKSAGTLFPRQLTFEYNENPIQSTDNQPELLIKLLSDDLDFQNIDGKYASHNFHSFPAKFPPQLPQKFISVLTKPGEIVLDPMSGSGTTVLEAYFSGRIGIGCDIDPLAIMISKVKTTYLNPNELIRFSHQIIKNAKSELLNEKKNLENILTSRWSPGTKAFVEYWFTDEIRMQLQSLSNQINKIQNPDIRTFFKLVFSAIIITKSGGVSLALDLAHTRPHKAKITFSADSKVIYGNEHLAGNDLRNKILIKKLRNPFDEFEKRAKSNIKGLLSLDGGQIKPQICFGNAQKLPLQDESIDLVVTSPPYASNAIDYMRAHKFSLVWFGYKTEELTSKRKEYIGSEMVQKFNGENLPEYTQGIVNEITKLDAKKGKVLNRYYSEMTKVLREMYRILKSNKAAIFVVGSSIMRAKDTETQNCLAEIGQSVGFKVPKIGVRKIDRNKRMLPVGQITNKNSQIQQRMHEEYIIGFYKP